MSSWIPVTLGLPKDGEEVLISDFGSWVTQAYWHEDSKTFIHEEGFTWDLKKALAWQRLPEPYDPKKKSIGTTHYCPFQHEGSAPCKKESCALWSSEHRKCSIVAIADRLKVSEDV